ncbi:uncharacterized protein LOC126737669 isoform X2 [Anthonomus grandis grandis]|uniref:uncharacterized protein LOC126737669 isoform X2 n=1 Tax=Anthonomus grandis grandis TaxID=2921223 RepID=UPI002165354B|nr:uncharacterized protein LOC126737669 isoform X2 [Anthonomus grandis grandis]
MQETHIEAGYCKIATLTYRVRDAIAFEITGVDFAGPLFIKSGEKVWICLFTCAVYRAVHLELCSSLSVVCFIQALRRFIARRGRPRTIYSDNGTNFVGTDNAFSRVDFKKFAETSSTERIQWRFNPPTAAWWGGFWERLVGVLKQLLRKVLGRALLDYESLLTIICDCEAIINSRPLTCSSTNPNELVPLTPIMFLRDQLVSGVPDCDAVDRHSLSRKVQHRQKLAEDLGRRFRNEYLGQLQLWSKGSSSYQVKMGDVVFIGNNLDKRVNWPLGRVIELLPGKDGEVRVVRVSTERGQLLRPVQRLYPLECAEEGLMDSKALTSPKSRLAETNVPCEDSSESAGDIETANPGVSKSRVPEPNVDNTAYVSRSGRTVRVPVRYRDND